jgi:hypothetical protein
VNGWLDAVVLLEQGSAICAGVNLGGGRVGTAYHCVAPGGRPRVTTRSGERAVGRVVAVDRGADLAVVEVAIGAPALGLGVAPAVGSEVWTLGHPLAGDPPEGWFAGTLRWSAALGVVSAVGEEALQVSAPVNPGNSGGPVVDAEGRVVGIVSRRLTGDGLGFAARAERLAALVQAEPRALSPAGGTVAVEVVVHGQSGEGALPAIGGRAELSARDRFVVTVGAAAPASPRWTAARFGSAASQVLESAAGPRIRLGRGPWSTYIDGFGGVVSLARWTADPADPLDLSTEQTAAWQVGGAVCVRQIGLELAALPDEGIGRASVILRWPGVVRVF